MTLVIRRTGQPARRPPSATELQQLLDAVVEVRGDGVDTHVLGTGVEVALAAAATSSGRP